MKRIMHTPPVFFVALPVVLWALMAWRPTPARDGTVDDGAQTDR